MRRNCAVPHEKKRFKAAKRRAPLAAVPANSVERYALTDGAVIARLRSPDGGAAVGNKHSFTVFHSEGQFQFCSARRRSEGQPHLFIVPLRRVFQNCAVGYPSLNLFYPFHYARNNRLFRAIAARRSPSVIRPQKRQDETMPPICMGGIFVIIWLYRSAKYAASARCSI